jgi:hypothetical protein
MMRDRRRFSARPLGGTLWEDERESVAAVGTVDEQVFPKLVGKSTAKEELSLIEPTLVSGGFSAPPCSTIETSIRRCRGVSPRGTTWNTVAGRTWLERCSEPC